MHTKTTRLVMLLATVGLATLAHAQSTVGELLEKGGKPMAKADLLQMMPLRIQTKWLNGQGEEELFFSVDGKITGTGHHYGSRSDSPAQGEWRLEDDGKMCTPKTFTAWNTHTTACWYFYSVGNDFYATQKTETNSRIGRVNAMVKVAP